MQNILFSNEHAVMGSITAANIVGLVIASRSNWASVTNYVERILRLKERDLGAAGRVGMPAYMILAHVSNEIQNRHLEERNGEDT